MTKPQRREDFDVSAADNLVSELKAIGHLINLVTERTGKLHEDTTDAVYFLSCLATDRIDKLDGLVRAARPN